MKNSLLTSVRSEPYQSSPMRNRYRLRFGAPYFMVPLIASALYADDSVPVAPTPTPTPTISAAANPARHNIYGSESVTLGQKSSKNIYFEVRGKDDLLLAEPWPTGITTSVSPTPAAGSALLADVDSSMSGRLKISLNGNNTTPNSYQVKISFTLPGEVTPRVRLITVDVVPEVERAANIGRININTVASVMDAKTARQAFGSRTSEQFHILDVMFANETESFKDVTKPDLLVYSSSISLPVKLECRYVGTLDKNKRSPFETENPKPHEWHAIPQDLVEIIRAPIASSDTEFGVPAAASAQGFRYLYRPYENEMIGTTLNSRNNDSSRETFFKTLRTVGLLGGFATATNAIRGSGDEVFNQFSSVLVPGLRQAMPDKAPEYRNNIERFGMKELEKIEYGGQVQRKLFIPSQAISGILPGYLVRINGVYTNSLTLKVSVIDKENTQTQKSNS